MRAIFELMLAIPLAGCLVGPLSIGPHERRDRSREGACGSQRRRGLPKLRRQAGLSSYVQCRATQAAAHEQEDAVVAAAPPPPQPAMAPIPGPPANAADLPDDADGRNVADDLQLRRAHRTSHFSTRLRLLPTFFTAFLTDGLDRPVFLAS